jgi:TPR repeat protein
MAEQGNISAQLALAALYDKGEQIPKDKVLSAQWYRKAAEQGSEVAKKAIAELGL